MTREQVMQALVLAVGEIQIESGYNTDAGKRIFRYPVNLDQLDDNDFPCVVVTDAYQPDQIRTLDREKDMVTLPLEIYACAKSDVDFREGDMPTRVNELRADLKKAITTVNVFGSAPTGTGSLRRISAEPYFDVDTPFGYCMMRIELLFGED